MKRFTIAVIGAALLTAPGFAAGSGAQGMMMMREHHEAMARMHELLSEASGAEASEERRRLMAEHYELMQSRMGMMSGRGGMMRGSQDCQQRMTMMQDLMNQMMAREEMMQDGASEDDGDPE